jgi:hypothetical protein
MRCRVKKPLFLYYDLRVLAAALLLLFVSRFESTVRANQGEQMLVRSRKRTSLVRTVKPQNDCQIGSALGSIIRKSNPSTGRTRRRATVSKCFPHQPGRFSSPMHAEFSSLAADRISCMHGPGRVMPCTLRLRPSGTVVSVCLAALAGFRWRNVTHEEDFCCNSTGISAACRGTYIPHRHFYRCEWLVVNITSFILSQVVPFLARL